MSQLQGRIALVTRAGSARSLALGLAERGATVVVGMSTERSASSLARQLARTSGNPHIHALVLDLASLESVRRAAREFLARYQRLHLLVTDTSVRVGPVLLANLLLDTMKRSGCGRVVRLTKASDRQQIWAARTFALPLRGRH